MLGSQDLCKYQLESGSQCLSDRMGYNGSGKSNSGKKLPKYNSERKASDTIIHSHNNQHYYNYSDTKKINSEGVTDMKKSCNYLELPKTNYASHKAKASDNYSSGKLSYRKDSSEGYVSDCST